MLDVGCGTGGSAFFMARHYGVSVHGIDLSSNMIAIARDRLNREEETIKQKVRHKRTHGFLHLSTNLQYGTRPNNVLLFCFLK